MTEEIEVLSHCQGCEALYSFYFVRAIELFKKMGNTCRNGKVYLKWFVWYLSPNKSHRPTKSIIVCVKCVPNWSLWYNVWVFWRVLNGNAWNGHGWKGRVFYLVIRCKTNAFVSSNLAIIALWYHVNTFRQSITSKPSLLSVRKQKYFTSWKWWIAVKNLIMHREIWARDSQCDKWSHLWCHSFTKGICALIISWKHVVPFTTN